MRSEMRSRLLEGIAQGRLWLDRLVRNSGAGIATLALESKLSEKSVRSTLSLALLAPVIVEAAIEGRLPRGLTSTQMTDLPVDWQDQRKVIGLI